MQSRRPPEPPDHRRLAVDDVYREGFLPKDSVRP